MLHIKFGYCTTFQEILPITVLGSHEAECTFDLFEERFMVTASRSQSVSQLTSELDHKLGTDTEGLNDTEKDLNRFERQTDSKIAKWGFKTLAGVFGFGRNMCTPFQETSKDLDRLAKQTDSAVGRKAYQALGAAFGFGSTAFKLPNDIVMGTVDFASNPVGTITSLPETIQHNGDAMISGAALVADGRTAEGIALLTEGAAGDAMMAGAVTGIIKGAPKVYTAYTESVNAVLKVATDRRPTIFNADPFDVMVRTNPELGGFRFPKTSSTENAGTLTTKPVGAPIQYEVTWGFCIERVASEMVALANDTQKSVVATFNGKKLVANPGDSPHTVVAPVKIKLDPRLLTIDVPLETKTLSND